MSVIIDGQMNVGLVCRQGSRLDSDNQPYVQPYAQTGVHPYAQPYVQTDVQHRSGPVMDAVGSKVICVFTVIHQMM